MMFELKTKTDNAAFHEAPGAERSELARILRDLAGRLEEGDSRSGGSLRDINGNRVGRWSLHWTR